MASSPKKTMFKLPRLKTKEELLKSSPELFNKLLAEDLGSARSTSATYATAKSPTKASAPLSPVRKLHSAGTMMDTPRFDEMVVTEEMMVAKELETVKAEQEKLKNQLKKVKEEAGSTGGEAQQLYIKQLMQELELKKGHLNKLREETRSVEDRIKHLRDDDVDCARLTPGGCEEEQRYISELKAEMAHVEEELAEAEAKNRLYFLLGERTRREHLASDMRVRAAQDMKKACLEDLSVLSSHLNEKRQEREAAEREAARLRVILEETKLDNQKKLRERRKEVRELKRRQQRDHERELKKRQKEAEEDKARKEKLAQQKAEHEKYEKEVASLAPKIDALEALWNRVRTISGADTPEDVLAYWNSLKQKQQSMKDLVRLAEQREAAAKSEVAKLVPSKAAIYVDPHSEEEEQQQQQQQQQQEQQQQEQEQQQQQQQQQHAGAEGAGEGAVSVPSSPTVARPFSATKPPSAISVESKRADTLRYKYGKLRSVVISAEQGLSALLQRLMVALQELPPDSPHVGGSRAMGSDQRRSKDSAAASGQRDVRSPGSMRNGTSRGSESGSINRGMIGNLARKPSLGMHHNTSGRVSPGGLQTQIETASEGAGSAEEVAPATGLIGTMRSGAGDDHSAAPNLGELLSSITDRLAKLQAAGAEGHGDQGGEDAIPGSERALMRGLVRRTWTGAPWLDSLAAGPMDLTKLPTMKRQKGKKKDLSSGLDLSRIMGYNADAPEPAEPAPAADSDDGGSEEDDGVVGRNFIKVRAAKMAARHHAALKLRGE